MSIIVIPVLLAPILGPTVGGLLLEHLGWRWIFFINLPVGVAAVLAGLRQLPRDRGGREQAGHFDAIGLGLLATGLVGVTFGLAETAGGILQAKVVIPIAAGLLLTVAFVLRALRVERPILDVRLYRNRAFASASFCTFCLGAALFGASVLLPLYFQVVRRESAIDTGLLLMPQAVGVALAMAISGRVVDRIGGGKVALVGVFVTALTTIPFAFFGDGDSYWLIGGAMLLRGAGIGLAMLPAMTAAFAAMSPAQISDATPQLNVLQRVGGSIGTAILTVVLQNHFDAIAGVASSGDLAEAFRAAYWWAVGVTAAAAIPALVLVRAEGRARRQATQRAAPEEPGGAPA